MEELKLRTVNRIIKIDEILLFPEAIILKLYRLIKAKLWPARKKLNLHMIIWIAYSDPSWEIMET
jgi:hypothetical protein